MPTDLKISQFVDGNAIQPNDEIAANRAGVNTKVFVGTAAAMDVGSGPTDIPTNTTVSSTIANTLQGTSNTSNTIGLGSKSFDTQSGKSFETGRSLLITSNSSPSTLRMTGIVTAYNTVTGVLAITIQGITGSGTHSDWSIRVSGDKGETGATGPQGPQGIPGLGAVASVSGTTNRITSTGGANPVIDIGPDVVTKTGIETLTNKTVNGVVLATGGSAAEFLNKAGNYVTPTTNPLGALLGSVTVTNQATLNLVSLFSGTYKKYMLDVKGLVPVNNNVVLQAKISTNNGSSYLAGTTYNSGCHHANAGGAGYGGASNAAFFVLSVAMANAGGFSGRIYVNIETGEFNYHGLGYRLESGNVPGVQSCAGRNVTAAVNALQFYMSAGNISGTIDVYGQI